MAPVRLESVALRSRIKHSTTEPLRSLYKKLNMIITVALYVVAVAELESAMVHFYKKS